MKFFLFYLITELIFFTYEIRLGPIERFRIFWKKNFFRDRDDKLWIFIKYFVTRQKEYLFRRSIVLLKDKCQGVYICKEHLLGSVKFHKHQNSLSFRGYILDTQMFYIRPSIRGKQIQEQMFMRVLHKKNPIFKRNVLLLVELRLEKRTICSRPCMTYPISTLLITGLTRHSRGASGAMKSLSKYK